ncbi:hypothetical protein AX15_002195 [Amanita polypyramis BW_CC]|nr:hypothetical protein AX15_002195 [Amanita polypyramis BW_CC]
MTTISSHNPFRPQALSPNPTGSSINPPPSFHTVAGDDETTIVPQHHDHELPAIPETLEHGDSERELPPIPSSPSLGEREATPYRRRARSLSPVITVDPLDSEEPPAYTPSADIHRGETTLESGPRRPFQQRSAQRTGRSPIPSPRLTPTSTGSYGYVSPTPTGFASNSFPSRRGRRRYNFLQQLTDSLAEQLEHIGNVLDPPGSSTTRTALYPQPPPPQVPLQSSLGPVTTGTTVSTPAPSFTYTSPPLPPRQPQLQLQTQTQPQPRYLSPNPTGSSSSTRVRSASAGTSPTTTEPRSDFARDFYAAGAAQGVLNLDSASDSSSDDNHDYNRRPLPHGHNNEIENDEAIARLLSAESDERPSPPPHAPSLTPRTIQRRHSSSGSHPPTPERLGMSPPSPSSPNLARSPRPPSSPLSPPHSPRFPSSPAPSGSGTGGSRPGLDDSSRPTTRPMPGRVLLRDGKILVYPNGYTCRKCSNTGYRDKHSNPFHPCKKCWNKFSKLFTPALLYAPASNGTTSLQRPLPSRAPVSLPLPQGSGPGSIRGSPAGLNKLRLSHSSQSFRGRHQYSPSEPPPTTTRNNHSLFSSPSPPPSVPLPPRIVTIPYGMGAGPPGSIVYPAGDPRLGGSQCWRCGGSGRVSYFILDNSQCGECDGIGRLYR